MKTDRVMQTRQGGEPSQRSGGAAPAQRMVADTPRQRDEAAHIAQLKGKGEARGKMPSSKKGKGK